MRVHVSGILLVMWALLQGTSSCWAKSESPSASDRETACSALRQADFSRVDGAATSVIDAHLMLAKEGLPDYCLVRGYVWPQVFFQILLPADHWNGKFLQLGCGGTCGLLPGLGQDDWCPLHRGYACIFSDTGHEGGSNQGLWAYNNLQAQVDFGWRSTHVTNIAGKSIVARYYSRPAKYAYFEGCSLGSQQALTEAQRFPADFDGIIAGGVWVGDTDSSMDFVWGARALRGADGKPLLSRAEMQMVHDAVLAKCDLSDGVKDGLISNPLACRFDPASLRCTTGGKAQCLTDTQVKAVQQVYAGPTTSTGMRLSSGGPLPGGEQDWIRDSGGEVAVGEWIMSDGGPAIAEDWGTTYFRWLASPAGGPAWNISDLNFDRDYARFSNGARLSPIYESNPDLRKFKKAGGKLMLYVGWKEWSDPRKAIDYYETVEKTMGGASSTQDFFRLFMLPGANHCGGGEGAWAADYLTSMENWVETGRPPEVIIGAHVRGSREDIAKLRFPLTSSVSVDFTRPIYPYPLWPRYSGQGDPNRAENFKPARP